MYYDIFIPTDTPLTAGTSVFNPASTLTGLRSLDNPVTKRIFINDAGQVETKQYQKAYLFRAIPQVIEGIRALGDFIITYSSDPMVGLIRGLSPSGDLESARRIKTVFPEHPEGTPWVMLDIDGITLPDGISDISADGIRWLVANKLPVEFHSVTFFYQFSSRSGVLKEDGTPCQCRFKIDTLSC